jgi:hypothetical protein
MTKIEELKNYKPYFFKFENGVKKKIFYEVSFYCNKNKIIHPNLKSVLKCKDCITIEDNFKND